MVITATSDLFTILRLPPPPSNFLFCNKSLNIELDSVGTYCRLVSVVPARALSYDGARCGLFTVVMTVICGLNLIYSEIKLDIVRCMFSCQRHGCNCFHRYRLMKNTTAPACWQLFLTGVGVISLTYAEDYAEIFCLIPN